MIKKIFKNLTLFVTIVITITGLSCTNVFAEQQDKIQYTTLGDSIAAGYALPKDEKGYGELIATELGLEIQNLAIPGLNSEQLLQKLQNMQGSELENLKNAKLITISIGSNDILGPFLNMMTSSMSGNFGFGSASSIPPELSDELPENFLEDIPEDLYETASEFIDSGLEGMLSPYAEVFKNNLPLIVSEIKNLNPSAQIVFTNFYNPFKNIEIAQLDVNFNEMTDNLMQILNEILTTENNGDYKVADVYNAFETAYSEGENPVNVSMLAISFDPHPNAYGHELIKQAVINAISVDELYEPDLISESEQENQELMNTDDSTVMNVFEDKDVSENKRQQSQEESTGIIDTQTNKNSPETGVASSAAIFTGTIILISGAGFIVFKKKKN